MCDKGQILVLRDISSTKSRIRTKRLNALRALKITTLTILKDQVRTTSLHGKVIAQLSRHPCKDTETRTARHLQCVVNLTLGKSQILIICDESHT